MTTYATYEDWTVLGNSCPDDEREAESWLHRASRDVDTLTFNRIVERGFGALSDFQREIITEVVCLLAEWEMENSDLLDSPLSGYSINGVSAQLGDGAKVTTQSGVTVPLRLYGMLEQTGLCCRRL